MKTNRLPLDVINVAAPCTQPWEGMTGDDRVRFCEGCKKHVHNLSAMTRTDAERLVCEGAGSLCVRFSRDEAGRVQTLDYRAPVGHRGWRFWTSMSLCAAAVVAGVNGYLLARNKPAPTPPPPMLGKMVMGDICPAPAPAPATQPAVMGLIAPIPAVSVPQASSQSNPS